MKKFLPALVLLSFLAVLVLPKAVLAQVAPVACCKLGKNVSYVGKIGTVDCTAAAPCIFNAGIAVGEKIEANQCGEAAAVTTDCAPTGTPPTQTTSCITDKWGMICFFNTLYVVTDWIFAILIAIAAIMVLFGAFTLVTAAGAPEKVTSGRNYILYAAIGLIIAFLAKAIPAIVKTVAGV